MIGRGRGDSNRVDNTIEKATLNSEKILSHCNSEALKIADERKQHVGIAIQEQRLNVGAIEIILTTDFQQIHTSKRR